MFLAKLPKRFSLRSRAVISASSCGLVVGSVCLSMVSSGFAIARTGAVKPQVQSAGQSLNMFQTVRAAVQTHPSVRGAGQQVQQAKAGVDAARAGYKPQISGGLENQINSHRNTSYDSRFVYTAKLNGSQMLYDFGKVAGGVRRAEAGVRAGAAQVEQASNAIALNAAQAWVDAHLQQSLLQLANEQLAAVMSITDLVRERVEKGATSRSDIEQANSRVQSIRSQLLGAEADALSASLALMYLTGSSAPVSITGEIPAVLRGAACRYNTDGDIPSVRIANARRDEAKADLDLAKSQRYPTVTLDGSVGQALTNGSRLYGEHRTTGQVGFNVSMPLYQGGRVQAQEQGSLHQLRAAEDAVEQARLEMRQGFSDSKAQVEGWARRAWVLQTRVDSINETRGLYRDQYLHLGTRTLIELLNAEQEYHSARIEQAQGIHMEYRLAVQCLYFSDQMRSTFQLDDQQAVYGPIMSEGTMP